MKRIFPAFLLLVLFITGCSLPVNPRVDRVQASSHFLAKSYDLNVMTSTYVGSPMIKVRDYFVYRVESGYATPTSDFIAKGGIIELHGQRSVRYPVVGSTEHYGIPYDIVRIPDSKGYPFGMLVNDQGVPSGRVISNGILVVYGLDITPEKLNFERSFTERVDTQSAYTNYEILYGGTDGQSIKLTYREFSPDDMARQAFFQELVYPLGTQRIRFKNLAIQVHSADSERIVFTVLEDGY